MPPLKGIDRGINGTMLKALEEIGHGAQIAVVDASYDIPPGADVVDYAGDSSAKALKGILALVPHDPESTSHDFYFMHRDDNKYEGAAYEGFIDVEKSLQLSAFGLFRMDRPGAGGAVEPGFYSRANDPDVHTLFVRTRDERAFACAMFVVGHSQQ